MDNERRREQRLAHQKELREILLQNLSIYEEKLQLCADPKDAVSIIFEMAKLKLRLGRPEITSDNDPGLILDALDVTENWYTNQDLQYPYPQRLQEQRNFWQHRLGKPRGS